MDEKVPAVRIAVRNLWKIFGPDAHRLVDADWVRTASRTEVQERTGHVVAVRDVSFEVSVGEVFVVMGLSGSGKSTLIRCLIRLIEPTAGQIFIDGENILDYDPRQTMELRRHKTAMVFQHYGLFPHRTVIDNVAYGLEIQGMDRAGRYAKAQEVLTAVGLEGWETHYPDQLSGGMQQRVGIARALALDPEILLMDEPFSGLDPLIRRQMQDELVKLQAQLHKTIVFITHDLLEALKLGDRIAILRDGSIIQQGTPEQIVTNPVDEYVREFVQDVPKARVVRVTSIMQWPELILDETQSPQAAGTLMRERGIGWACVCGVDRQLAGVVTLEACTAGSAASLGEMCAASNTRVRADTTVQAVLPLVAGRSHPIPVVNDANQLLGVVDREAVLASLAESQGSGAKSG